MKPTYSDTICKILHTKSSSSISKPTSYERPPITKDIILMEGSTRL